MKLGRPNGAGGAGAQGGLAALTGRGAQHARRMLRTEIVPDAEGLRVTGVLLVPETHF